MLVKINSKTIILKNNLKYQTKTFKSKSNEINLCKIQNIFELPGTEVESRSPCLIYKNNKLNVGFT